VLKRPKPNLLEPQPAVLTLAGAQAILQIADERAVLVRQMREAFDRRDEREALRLARLVAGIEDNDEGYRI
jgi:hypothetical protein